MSPNATAGHECVFILLFFVGMELTGETVVQPEQHSVTRPVSMDNVSSIGVKQATSWSEGDVQDGHQD